MVVTLATTQGWVRFCGLTLHLARRWRRRGARRNIQTPISKIQGKFKFQASKLVPGFYLNSTRCGSQSRAPFPGAGRGSKALSKRPQGRAGGEKTNNGRSGSTALPGRCPPSRPSPRGEGAWFVRGVAGGWPGWATGWPQIRRRKGYGGQDRRRAGAPGWRTVCGLGNPRYSRLGSLRYEKTALSMNRLPGSWRQCASNFGGRNFP